MPIYYKNRDVGNVVYTGGGNEPLVVTGTPEWQSTIMSGNGYVYFVMPTMSHTPEEIYAAFNAGLDVYIRLSKASAAMYLGNSTTLPDIQYIDAKVYKVGDEQMLGGKYFEAVGEGYIGNTSSYFYRVVVTGGASQSITKCNASLYRHTST